MPPAHHSGYWDPAPRWILYSQVHPAVQVHTGIIVIPFLRPGHIVGILIVGDAGVIVIFRPPQGLLKATAIGCLIPHGPGEHTGPVFVPDDTFLRPVHRGRDIIRIVCYPGVVPPPFLLVGTLTSMALIVCLIHHIEAVLVAELVELGGIGVMAGADGVHVVGLHQPQVLMHLFQADGKACHRVAVVAVHPVKLDLLAIEVQHPVPDGHFPDTHALRDHFMGCLHDHPV